MLAEIYIGPDELTIYEHGVLPEILEGSKNPFTKPAWYDNLRPYTGLNTHRSKVVHDHRRRVWDQGFTTKGWSDKVRYDKYDTGLTIQQHYKHTKPKSNFTRFSLSRPLHRMLVRR